MVCPVMHADSVQAARQTQHVHQRAGAEHVSVRVSCVCPCQVKALNLHVLPAELAAVLRGTQNSLHAAATAITSCVCHSEKVGGLRINLIGEAGKQPGQGLVGPAEPGHA